MAFIQNIISKDLEVIPQGGNTVILRQKPFPDWQTSKQVEAAIAAAVKDTLASTAKSTGKTIASIPVPVAPSVVGTARNVSNLFVAGESFGFPRLLILIAGVVYTFDPAVDANGYRIAGVSQASGAVGANVEVAGSGVIRSPGAYVPDTVYYGGAGGVLTATPPATGVLVKVGISLDADHFLIDISTPVILI